MIRAALLMIMMAGLAAPAKAEPLLSLGGEWAGTGWASRGPDAPRERVRCRLTNRVDHAQGRLSVSGRCAAPGRRFDLSGRMTAEGGRLSGRWSNPFGAGVADVAGRSRGQTMTLSFRGRDPDTGERFKGQMRWTVGDDRFSITTASAPINGETYRVVGEINFERTGG